MWNIVNLPLATEVFQEYKEPNSLNELCKNCKCDGLELVWGGEDIAFDIPSNCCKGWHLTFFTDWLDFWNEDINLLNKKFGFPQFWQEYYKGDTKNAIINWYEQDIQRALKYNPEYIVFHVSNVSFEEVFTYKWIYSDEQIVDATAQIINKLLDGKDYKFKLLLENLPWPGFRFTNPKITERLLSKINYTNKGIMLDIGHLMCTNINIKTQSEGVEYIHKMLDTHGNLCKYIKGIHLHQSVSGNYVKSHTETLPQLPQSYHECFSVAYKHILNIDTHKPWTDNAIQSIINRINPDYLVHELASANRAEKVEKTRIQINTFNATGGK